MDETIETLRSLARALPIPEGRWHPHIELMRRVRDDLLAALDAIEADGVARAALEAYLEGEPAPPPPPSAALAALDALPVPEGQHPFLDEILPVLEAARLAQSALAAGGSSLAAA